MRIVLHIALVFLCIECSVAYAVVPQDIKGRVESATGKGIAGVVVTDGMNFTVTSGSGAYKMQLQPESRFVYVSTPAGYTCPSENTVVKFYMPIESGRKSYDFTLIPKPCDDTVHGFVAVADPQVHSEKEYLLLAEGAEDIGATVAGYPGIPFHGMGCGDIVSADHSFYAAHNKVMSASGLDFYNCMGNHDMKLWGRSFETSTEAYENVFGPAYYSYNVGEVHYVVLNDNFFIGRDWYYIGYLEEKQMRWLEQDLSYVSAGSTVIVTMHIPSTHGPEDQPGFSYATAQKSLANFKGLYAILEPYNTHIISGHLHTSSNRILGGRLMEHNIAAMSGAWWQGPLCTDGTPAGYAVFLVNGSDLSWYYKSVGYPEQYQMKVYAGEKYPEFDGLVVANIWNYDDEWTVELYENGAPKCRMERFEVIDHDAARMYSNKDRLEHKWIAPTPASHFFKSELPHNSGLLEIVAVDRFGNVYSQEVTLNDM